MTFDQFKNKHLGKGIDYDGNYGVQCFDLANQYCKDVVGCTGFVGLYAHQIYNNFNSLTQRTLQDTPTRRLLYQEKVTL